MKTYFVDSNFILRFILEDNKKQAQQAELFFEQARTGKIKLVVIPEVLMEVEYVLRGVYKKIKEEIVDILARIVDTPYLEIRQRLELAQALEIYGQLAVDLVDAFLFLSARKEKAEVLTFDKDFSKLARLKNEA